MAGRRAERAGGCADAVAGRLAENVRDASRVSRRARRQRAARPGSHRHGLGCRGPAVGRRDAGLRAGSGHSGTEPGSDRPGRRARRHQPRRHDGQAHRVRGWPRARALAQGDGSRRARRGAAEPVADARHERRPAHGHQGARDRRVRPARRPRRAERQRSASGARQLDPHRRQRRHGAVEGRQVRGAEDADRAASGA